MLHPNHFILIVYAGLALLTWFYPLWYVADITTSYDAMFDDIFEGWRESDDPEERDLVAQSADEDGEIAKKLSRVVCSVLWPVLVVAALWYSLKKLF